MTWWQYWALLDGDVVAWWASLAGDVACLWALLGVIVGCWCGVFVGIIGQGYWGWCGRFMGNVIGRRQNRWACPRLAQKWAFTRGLDGDKGCFGSYLKLCDFTLLFMILQVKLKLNKRISSETQTSWSKWTHMHINNDILQALKRLAHGLEWSPSKCT